MLGWTTTTTLVDVKGFYDHIDLLKLAEYAKGWQFPPQIMAMSIQTDLAPRLLHMSGWVADRPCWPRRSALTGERHGNHKARLLLYDTLSAIHRGLPRLGLGQWVDDIHLQAIGTLRTAAADTWHGIVLLRGRLAADRLVMATKTKIVSNNMHVAKFISLCLRRVGIEVKADRQGQTWALALLQGGAGPG